MPEDTDRPLVAVGVADSTTPACGRLAVFAQIAIECRFDVAALDAPH